MRLLEPVAVEREFATRLLADAGTPTVADDLVAALALLETRAGQDQHRRPDSCVAELEVVCGA